MLKISTAAMHCERNKKANLEKMLDEEKIIFHEIDDLKKSLFIGREVEFSGLFYLKDRQPSRYKLLAQENVYCNNK